MTTWTKDTVRTWIQNCNVDNDKHRAALSRALLFLYSRQTADEQNSQTTNHDNGMGFSGFDAEFLSSVAQGVQRYGNMTPRQAMVVKKRLARYAGQLLLMLDPSRIDSTPTARRTASARVDILPPAPPSLFNQEASFTLQAMF